MNTSILGPLAACLFLAVFSNALASEKKATDYVPVSWNQLIPADYDSKELENNIIKEYDIENLEHGSADYNELIGRLEKLQYEAPLSNEYDGIPIKIPGFVVPLDFDSDKVRKFLLVPYYGACIHTPPPPPNQIVYVELEEGIEIENTYEPVYVNGMMAVETQESEYGTAGYTLSGHKVEPYTE